MLPLSAETKSSILPLMLVQASVGMLSSSPLRTFPTDVKHERIGLSGASRLSGAAKLPFSTCSTPGNFSLKLFNPQRSHHRMVAGFEPLISMSFNVNPAYGIVEDRSVVLRTRAALSAPS